MGPPTPLTDQRDPPVSASHRHCRAPNRPRPPPPRAAEPVRALPARPGTTPRPSPSRRLRIAARPRSPRSLDRHGRRDEASVRADQALSRVPNTTRAIPAPLSTESPRSALPVHAETRPSLTACRSKLVTRPLLLSALQMEVLGSAAGRRRCPSPSPFCASSLAPEPTLAAAMPLPELGRCLDLLRPAVSATPARLCEIAVAHHIHRTAPGRESVPRGCFPAQAEASAAASIFIT